MLLEIMSSHIRNKQNEDCCMWLSDASCMCVFETFDFNSVVYSWSATKVQTLAINTIVTCIRFCVQSTVA